MSSLPGNIFSNFENLCYIPYAIDLQPKKDLATPHMMPLLRASCDNWNALKRV